MWSESENLRKHSSEDEDEDAQNAQKHSNIATNIH